MAWLIIAILSLALGVYEYNKTGLDGPAQWFFIGTFIAAMFFAFRRRQRKRFEDGADNDNSTGQK